MSKCPLTSLQFLDREPCDVEFEVIVDGDLLSVDDHGESHCSSVFRLPDDTYWEVCYFLHPNYGVQEDMIDEPVQVEPKETITIKWVPKDQN